MIEYYVKKKDVDKFEKTTEYSKKCWINVVDPTEEEINHLAEEFSLNMDSLVDGLDIHENSRFEVDDKKVYIYLTAPTKKVPSEYDTSFLIIYSKDLFITVSKHEIEIIDKMTESKVSRADFSFSRLLLKFLFMISRMFELSVRGTIKEIKKDKKDLSKLDNKDIEHLIGEEDKLNEYISSFGAMIQTYRKISRGKLINLFKRDEQLIEDLIIDLDESLTLCNSVLKTISNMRDYYSTKLSNELNKRVTTLTLFTIFLAIPTLIAGVYGMNITLPLQEHPSILFVLIGVVLGLWSVMFFILKKVRII